jgi:hypothetical protein
MKSTGPKAGTFFVRAHPAAGDTCLFCFFISVSRAAAHDYFKHNLHAAGVKT